MSDKPDWMTALEGMDAGGSGWDARQYSDPATHEGYRANTWRDPETGISHVDGYRSGQPGYTPGQQGTTYDDAGQKNGTFAYQDPNEFDPMEMLTKLALGAMFGGAAFSGLGGTLPSWAGGGAEVAGPGMPGWGSDLGLSEGAATVAGPGDPGWGSDLGGAGAPDTTYAGNIGSQSGPLASSLTKGLTMPSLSTLTNAAKILGPVLGLGGKGASTADTAAAPPHVFDEGNWTPPGWRTDRPMYRPGVDAIPEGWNKPGNGFNRN